MISASYLGFPRIHFTGLFKADIPTGNNYAEDYLISKYSDDIAYPSWHPNGTGEFTFINCVVTAVVYADGTRATTHGADPLIGEPVINNPAMAPAKLVDLDSPHHDLSSTLYGMRFGINWKPNTKNKENKNSFIGYWKPAILSRDFWLRQINDTTADRYTQTIGTQGSSKLVNVTWGKVTSKALKQLKHRYGDTDTLSVSVSLFNYTQPYQENLFLHGLVAGTIGVGTSEESLNFVGERVMHFENASLPQMAESNSCANVNVNKDWMFTAYFSVSKPKRVTVDFGNSIKIDFHGHVCDFGRLYLGMFVSDIATMSSKKVEVIGEIPYQKPQWFNETAGVNDFTLTHAQYHLSNSSLFAVVRFSDIDGKPDGKYPVCNDDQMSSPCVVVILKESRFNLRPVDHHVIRLEAEENVQVKLRLQEYGLKPTATKQVKLKDLSPNEPNKKSLLFANPVMTNEDGIATFNVTAAKEIGRPRGKLEMDGQVFVFGYCIELSENGRTKDQCEEGYTNTISFLVWDKTTYSEPVFWDDHIQPIFQQYERLYPAIHLTIGRI